MDAFEEKLIDLIPQLRQIARGIARNRDGADELVQMTLERALAKRDLYQPIGSFLGWLTLIMRRLFVDQIRRGARMVAMPEDGFADSPERAQVATQYENCLLDEVRTIMAELPADFRQVLTAVAIEGRSYEDVAAALGVPMGTVRSRLFRARAALAERMGETRVTTPVA